MIRQRQPLHPPLGRGRQCGVSLLIAACLSLIAACDPFALDNIPVVMIQNHTDQAVDVVIVGDAGGEISVVTGLGPGGEYPYDRLATTTCSPAVLVARDDSGREIDRSEGPICRPSVWVIDGVAPSPSE
jgi:hypothetical protein